MSKILALLTLASLHHSKDVETPPDFKMLHAKMNALTAGLLKNIDNQSEYLKVNKKDIEIMLAKTNNIKVSKHQRGRFRLGKKQPSFRHIKDDILNHRDILATAMEAHNNSIAAG